jgi:hypothetical protein
MDLKNLEILDTTTLKIKDAKGYPLSDCAIEIYGPGSMIYREAVVRWRKRNKAIDQDDEDGFLKSNAQFLADCTAGFNGLEYDGKTGRELYLAVYGNPKLGWLSGQVMQALPDWGKFSNPGVES